MFDTETDNRERGQVGIGTLIVFIALVLVAAIAAGVLINTAGFLQSQAEATGEESTDQVANGVQIVSASASADAGSIDGNVELTIQLSPGSDPVDLDQVRFQTTGDASESGTLSGGTLEAGDREPGIDLGFQPTAGDRIEITLTTADGSQTTDVLIVPDPISDDTETVRLT